MPDHFHDQLGPLVALTAAAMAAPRLRIGALVLDNDFRHPVALAKEAATLDLLTGGRLELGLGAGWSLFDYRRSGIPYDRPGVRIGRLEEAIVILKGLFGDGPFSFSGKHYQVTELDGLPKPVQKPHPPFMIGAGRRRMLSIAARQANIVNVSFSMQSGEWDHAASATGTAEATAEKVQWVRDAAGDGLDGIELSVPVFGGLVTGNRRQAAEEISARYGLSTEGVLGSPHFLVGSIDGIVEELEQRRADYGFSYIILSRGTYETMAPVVARLEGR